MDDELLRLQEELARVQGEEAVARLTENNVVDLLELLRRRRKIEVVHTITGKELITPEKLKEEVRDEIRLRGGRARVDEISVGIEVDFYKVEEVLHEIVHEDPDIYILLSPVEVITKDYFDDLCLDVNERAAIAGSISVASVASRHALPLELMKAQLESRVGSLLKVEMENGILFTDYFLQARIRKVRGAISGVTRPTPVKVLCESLGIISEHVENIINNHIDSTIGEIKSGEFVPSSFANLQRSSVDNLFQSSGCLTSKMAKRLMLPKGISTAFAFIQKSFPDAILLKSCIISSGHAHAFAASIAECVANRSYIDLRHCSPSELSDEDCLELFRHMDKEKHFGPVSFIQETFLISTGMIEFLRTQLLKEAVNAGRIAAENRPLEYTIVGSKSKAGSSKSKKDLAGALEDSYLKDQVQRATNITAISKQVTKYCPALQEEESSLVEDIASLFQSELRAQFLETFNHIDLSIHSSSVAGQRQRVDWLEESFTERFNELQVCAKGIDKVLKQVEIVNHEESGEEDIDFEKSTFKQFIIANFVKPVIGLIVEHECTREGVSFLENGSSVVHQEKNWRSTEICMAAIGKLSDKEQREELRNLLTIASQDKNRGSFENLVEDIAQVAKSCSFIARKPDKKTERSILQAARQKLLTWLSCCNSDSQLVASSSALVLLQCKGYLVPVPKPPSVHEEQVDYSCYRYLLPFVKSILPKERGDALQSIALGESDVDIVEEVKFFSSQKNPATIS